MKRDIYFINFSAGEVFSKIGRISKSGTNPIMMTMAQGAPYRLKIAGVQTDVSKLRAISFRMRHPGTGDIKSGISSWFEDTGPAYIVTTKARTGGGSGVWLTVPYLPEPEPGYRWEAIPTYIFDIPNKQRYKLPYRRTLELDVDWDNIKVEIMDYYPNVDDRHNKSWKEISPTNSINVYHYDTIRVTTKNETKVFTEETGFYETDTKVDIFVNDENNAFSRIVDREPVNKLVAHIVHTEPITTTVEETRTEPIPFEIEYTQVRSLPIGTETVIQEGTLGELTIIEQATYVDGMETNRIILSKTVTKEPTTRIVAMGPRDPNLADLSLIVGSRDNSTITIEGHPETYDVGNTIPLFIGDTLIIKAKPAYVITEKSHLEVRTFGDEYPLDISDDKQTVTIQITSDFVNGRRWSHLYIYTTARVSGYTNYNNLYLVDGDSLKELNTHRFVIESNAVMIADYGQYIINLIELPMPINEDILLPDSSINLGNFTVPNTSVPVLNNDKLYVDLGDIEIPNKYNNLLDFNQTTVTIHLPFTHSVQIENKYAIGQTVSIEYIVDLYTGETTANFRTTKLDNKLFHSEPVLLGKTVPMATASSPTRIASVRGSLSSIKAGVHNNIYTAYAEVSRHVPEQLDNIYNVNIISNTTLSNESGYLIVSNIKLETQATYTERDMILSLLSTGVHIN